LGARLGRLGLGLAGLELGGHPVVPVRAVLGVLRRLGHVLELRGAALSALLGRPVRGRRPRLPGRRPARGRAGGARLREGLLPRGAIVLVGALAAAAGRRREGGGGDHREHFGSTHGYGLSRATHSAQFSTSSGSLVPTITTALGSVSASRSRGSRESRS